MVCVLFCIRQRVDGGKTGSATDRRTGLQMQIHVNTPYLLNHALERLLLGTDTPPAISFTLPIMWWSA